MSGRAAPTIVLSSNTMNCPRHATANNAPCPERVFAPPRDAVAVVLSFGVTVVPSL
ncbi:hypothetical protein GCM10018792_53240 [Streptomyces rubradiris]|nr:hypothetical protein GCM10018792_53240 [Streptomyces rubradiris]